MDFYESIRENFLKALKTKYDTNIDFSKVVVEAPKDKTHGHAATNAALVLSKQLSMKPRDLAGELSSFFESQEQIEKVDIAGPGFINLTFAPVFFQNLLKDILKNKTNFGKIDLGKGQKTNIESLSTNPTGPIHMGHCRIAVIGDILSNLLEYVGYDVTREYYINDAGGQVDVLARSLYHRYQELFGVDVGPMPEGCYPGDYLIFVAEKLREEEKDRFLNTPEEKWLPYLRIFAVNAMMEMIRKDLDGVGVHFDVYTSERLLTEDGYLDKAYDFLEKQGYIYKGTLEAPKGIETTADFEIKEQMLFKATDFGDDMDRALKRSNGTWSYFGGDTGYHFHKLERGFENLIIILGADHTGYLKRIGAVVKAMSNDKAHLDVKTAQMVKVLRGGEVVKMSKRAGSFVTMREVVEEVGIDVVRFIMLTRRDDAPLDFDLNAVVEQSKDNPVFYVQYAFARGSSVLRHAQENYAAALEALEKNNLDSLTDEAELELIRTLCEWPKVLKNAALAHEPHRIAFYLQEVATAFHSLWHKGKDDTTLRFIQENDQAKTLARLSLIKAMLYILEAGLSIMGVKPRQEM